MTMGKMRNILHHFNSNIICYNNSITRCWASWERFLFLSAVLSRTATEVKTFLEGLVRGLILGIFICLSCKNILKNHAFTNSIGEFIIISFYHLDYQWVECNLFLALCKLDQQNLQHFNFVHVTWSACYLVHNSILWILFVCKEGQGVTVTFVVSSKVLLPLSTLTTEDSVLSKLSETLSAFLTAYICWYCESVRNILTYLTGM